jgi:cytochrome P450
MFRYRVLAAFGPNIVASEGEEWKKYRKITAPAFSEVVYRAIGSVRRLMLT